MISTRDVSQAWVYNRPIHQPQEPLLGCTPPARSNDSETSKLDRTYVMTPLISSALLRHFEGMRCALSLVPLAGRRPTRAQIAGRSYQVLTAGSHMLIGQDRWSYRAVPQPCRSRLCCCPDLLVVISLASLDRSWQMRH
jgi:hypothetical protein